MKVIESFNVHINRNKNTLNEIISYTTYAELFLYGRKNNHKATTKLDIEDIPKVKNYKWCLDSYGYVMNHALGRLHRVLINTPKGLVTDHINHDILDNRKSNLRIVTYQQNQFNSKAKGYYFNIKRNKWFAKLMINRKEIFLGYFEFESDAKKARKEAEIKYFGEYKYEK